ncbi:hypothetical protein [Aridibaculum aurantiacum]|uniref:hypothetical protein n=1 Tax=Aridibaculum aurantiacum TaxID=2810307 RepID=UPI001A97C012|nr:hypothetical protein [Aridibaculum aurantiacum]
MSKRIWWVAAGITIIYWGTYQGIEGYKLFTYIKPIYKYSINFFLLLLVYLVGWYGLKKEKKDWMQGTWFWVYGFVILGVLFFGTLDLLFGVGNTNLRNFLFSLRMFFTSPLPFGILVLLSRMEKPVAVGNKQQ